MLNIKSQILDEIIEVPKDIFDYFLLGAEGFSEAQLMVKSVISDPDAIMYPAELKYIFFRRWLKGACILNAEHNDEKEKIVATKFEFEPSLPFEKIKEWADKSIVIYSRFDIKSKE